MLEKIHNVFYIAMESGTFRNKREMMNEFGSSALKITLLKMKTRTMRKVVRKIKCFLLELCWKTKEIFKKKIYGEV